MGTRGELTRRLFLACIGTVLIAEASVAATLYVDGLCPTGGTGAQLACGPSGPFRTIQDAVSAMAPGDTVAVRAGVYEERVVITRTCTAAAPCVIGPYGNERPIVRGMLRRSDWSPGSAAGVWRREMEATPDELTTQQPDVYHPMTLYQDTGGSLMTPLGYDGDNVAAPRDGHYSVEPATHTLIVNPIGTAEPAAAIYVPHFTTLIQFDLPAAYVTLRGLTLEGVRGIFVKAVNLGTGGIAGLVIEDNQLRYFPRFGIHINEASAPIIRNNLIEVGGRGLGAYGGGSYGAYALRLFGVHDAWIEGNTLAHLGDSCAWCDPPWNDNNHNNLDQQVYANGIDYKQTLGGTIINNTIVDIAYFGIGLDVSREVTVANNWIEQARLGLLTRTQGPTSAFPSCGDNVFSDNVVRDSQTGIRVEDDLYPGSTFLARIERTTFTDTPTPYDVPNQPYVIVIDGTPSTTIPPPSTSTSVTTSSTSPRSASTTTTLAGLERYVEGSKLLLKDEPGHPSARRFVLRSHDAARLGVTGGDILTALQLDGGSVRVSALGGDGFGTTYNLPALGWAGSRRRRPDGGVRYRDPDGPVTTVVVRSNGALFIAAKGPLLQHTLGTEPEVVGVELQLGPYRYCWAFGGRVQRFRIGEKLVRKAAPRPVSCRLEASSTTARITFGAR